MNETAPSLWVIALIFPESDADTTVSWTAYVLGQLLFYHAISLSLLTCLVAQILRDNYNRSMVTSGFGVVIGSKLAIVCLLLNIYRRAIVTGDQTSSAEQQWRQRQQIDLLQPATAIWTAASACVVCWLLIRHVDRTARKWSYCALLVYYVWELMLLFVTLPMEL